VVLVVVVVWLQCEEPQPFPCHTKTDYTLRGSHGHLTLESSHRLVPSCAVKGEYGAAVVVWLQCEEPQPFPFHTKTDYTLSYSGSH
jgi:hypothetical protein